MTTGQAPRRPRVRPDVGAWTVRAEGLNETIRALRAMDKVLPKEVRKAAKEAAEPIAADARRRYAQHYTSRSGKTQRSIKALASQRDARISFGGSKFPHAPGQEFGSDRYRQFAPWSGKVQSGLGSNGKAVYPAVRDGADAFADRVASGFDDLARSLGFEDTPEGSVS